jgi:hypothetical protein
MWTLPRFFLVGAIAVLSLTLGVSPARAITNGSYDGNDHPNVGIVYLRGVPATAGFCSGSLLSAHEFLTAGHCTAAFTAFGLTPDMLYVSFDAQVSLSPAFVITTAHPVVVTGWDTHPGFKTAAANAGPTLANDVGVIHLADNVALTPIDLPEVGFLDAEAARGGLRDHVFTEVGYGLNSLDRLFWAPGATFTWDHQREAVLSPFMALTPQHLQTQGGVLGGDSGGPVFYGGADPNLAVATNVSGDPLGGALGVGQRLDTACVLDFLDDYR